MGGGEMATASAPSPASGPARMDSSQIVCVGGLDSTKCSMEWPADYSVEALALAIQEWPMNSQFDLNMDSSFQRGFLEDIVGHSSSSENPESKDEVAFDDHLEGETDVEDLFPPTPEDELDEAIVDKATMRREARSKDAKAKALKIRQVKQRADACTSEDVFVLSDSCSDDNKEIINLSDDDGAVLESKIALRKRKSVAKPVKKRVYYDESKSNAHEQFVLDLCFIDITQLRKALENYHIANCRNFTYLKNNQERVVVCCSSDGTCPFMLHSSTIKGERTHCIRQIMLPHTCGTKTDTSRINSSWLAKKYEDFIKSDPSMCVTALMDAVLRDHGVEISKHMAYRAKNRALEAVVGDEDAQFTRIRDYMQTVMDKDPGSRCHVTTVQPVPEKNPRFWGLFFTLNAQIQGFLNGCRPFIGIDGCFLKLGNGAQVPGTRVRA
ncbi:hypothetical protein QYE76_006278 [Lolium multiflorum]|uniref:Transposase MuDR plant domain-containing protein n=1 Tax=Lolium multiflorum TaxID=4521 RepID=A0AAD8RUE4_LOLMU|nr:hypothetical protein QYE76_006278 [Lolium multiflorum]